MATVKEEVKKLIDALPDDATVEDVQYALYVRERVARGMREVEAGHVITQEEAELRMLKWIRK